MKTFEIFEMLVTDTYHLEGLTIFSGFVSPPVGFIRSCDCEVVLNGKVMTYIHIDSEMLPLSKDPAPRSISTTDAVDLVSLGMGSNGFVIRSRRRRA
jgi:hypothetical protein